ncbi:hypothetical protein MRX96_045177 [Rhipicephalus microplus]
MSIVTESVLLFNIRTTARTAMPVFPVGVKKTTYSSAAPTVATRRLSIISGGTGCLTVKVLDNVTEHTAAA